MRLYPEKLEQHLQQQLLPVYLVSGDETLLVQEACDSIRRHCRNQGYGEREVYEVDAQFDWQQLVAAGNALSLFADKKIVELRLASAKVDKTASAAICEYCENADGNTTLLISSGRMDRNSQRGKWFKAIDQTGAYLQLWPIERRQLPQWLAQRCQAMGLNIDRQALELLADRVEGNLLAAAQEVEKLQVLCGDQAVSADMVAATVANSARYDIFKLIDNALQGDASAALRMLASLRAEGAEGIPLLGALCRELRLLLNCAQWIEQGNGIERVLDDSRVWDKRKPLYKKALQRLKSTQLASLLRQSGQIDQALKGQLNDDGWQLLDKLVAELAGSPL